MSKIEVNAVEPQCGTTLTLGASGDTVTLGSGASQSGFGRTGTVDWQTGSIKTANFTAASGEGYFCNTSGGAFTATLPASPSAGDIVSFSDYTNTFQTNNLTIGRNSEPIGGIAKDAILGTEGQSVTFVYVDGTEGWKNIQDSTSNVIGNQFIQATGGTITTSGNCKIHTFTGPGTFTVSQVHPCSANNQVSYLVVAGGGGGGRDVGGGAGAGGFREDKSPVTPYTASPLEGAGTITVTATAFPITVGAGGTGGSPSPPSCVATNGANSVFSTITSAGGGAGGGHPGDPGSNGGSGGGGAGYNTTTTGGSGNTPPVSPPQGNNGGSAPSPSVAQTGGGGGGAGGAGSNSTSPGTAFASGGAGATTNINGSPVTYAAGGRGAGDGSPNPQAGGANTGDGADGGGTGPLGNDGPNGGSGVVIIRYKYQ
jgi:hypothetical protein